MKIFEEAGWEKTTTSSTSNGGYSCSKENSKDVLEDKEFTLYKKLLKLIQENHVATLSQQQYMISTKDRIFTFAYHSSESISVNVSGTAYGRYEFSVFNSKFLISALKLKQESQEKETSERTLNELNSLL